MFLDSVSNRNIMLHCALHLWSILDSERSNARIRFTYEGCPESNAQFALNK